MAKINTFYGGISNNGYFGTKGQYQYSVGIDIYNNPRVAQISPRRNSIKDLGNGGYATTFIIIGDNTFAFTANSRVYCISTGSPVQVYTGSGGAFVSCMIFGQYLYWFAGTKIFYSLLTDINITSWATVTELTTGVNSTSKRSVAVKDNKMFFANGKYVSYIDQSVPGTIQNVNTNFYESDVMGLTIHAESLWIYLESGLILFYDIGASDVKSYKRLEQKVLAVKQSPNIDYVVLGDGNSTSLIENYGIGQNSDKTVFTSYYNSNINNILGESSSLTNMKFSFLYPGNNDCMGYYNGILYLPVSTPTKGSGTTGLATYGNIYQIGLPKSLTVSRSGSLGLGEYQGSLGGIFAHSNGIWLGFNYLPGGNNYYAENIPLPSSKADPDTLGYIVLLTDDGGQTGILKQLVGDVRVGAYIPSGTTVTIKYSIDGGSLVTYATLSSSNDRYHRIYNQMPNFSEISWYIELSTTSSSILVSPQLFDFDYTLKTVTS